MAKTPGVTRREIDLSDILIVNGVSNGAVVVRSPMGPINRPVQIANDKEYIETFGKPVYTSGANDVESSTNRFIPDYGYGSYAALEFLKESSQLAVVRGWTIADKFSNAFVKGDLGTSAYTSAHSGNYPSVAPAATYPEFDKVDEIQALDGFNGTNGCLNVFANSPSSEGNNIAITVEPFSPWADWRYSYDPYPSDITAASATTLTDMNTSAYYPIAEKLFKINVFVKPNGMTWDDIIDKTGRVGLGLETSQTATYTVVSGTTPTASVYRLDPVETFYGSLTSVMDASNNDMWIESVVNGNSKYIYVKTNTTVATKFTGVGSYLNLANKRDISGIFVLTDHLVKLDNGASNQSTGINNIAGWSGFQDREYSNVSILINPDYSTAVKLEVARIAAKRMDCIGTGQVGALTDLSRDQIRTAEKYGYANPSYMALYAGYSKVFDSYNNKYVYLPNSIFGAALMARVDNVSNPWTAPAGINRGVLPVFDQKKIFTEFDIGEIYERNINCVKFIRGVGFAMWGQKTAQLKKSALDRINVRRLLLYLENNIESALNQFVFENNTDKTRLRIANIIDEFLRSVYAGGGVTGYKVVCDASNNPPSVIDANQLNVDLYVQPVRVAEFIKLTTVVLRSGVSISEAV